jgi:spermidine synthase
MAQKVWPAAGTAEEQGIADDTREPATARATGQGWLLFLAAIFFLSGAAGLIYELLWLRILALTFGVTNHAITTVLASFMAGLALGSALAGRIADRIRHPLRAYVLVEALIGVTAVLTPLAFRLMDVAYRAAYPHLAGSPALLTAARFAFAFVILLVPTSLMGATLPILLRSSLLRSGHAGSHLSLLYAVNTSGAILGCLLTPFVLVGALGIRRSLVLAALLNLLAAALAALPAWRRGPGREPLTVPDPGPPLEPEVTLPSYPPAVRQAALWAMGLSGLLSLAYEVVWARLLATVFDATVYAFAIMLATYLFGLACGSAFVKPWLRRRLPWPLLLALVEGLIGAGALFSVYCLAHFGWSGAAAVSLRYTVLVALIALFPATFMMGASFPIAAEIFTAGRADVGKSVGAIYAVNVCGSICGSLLGGALLVPHVGVERSVALLVAGNALLGLALLLLTPGLRLVTRVSGALAGILVFGVGLAAMPPPYATLFANRFPNEKVVWRDEGIENTVTVADGVGRRVLLIDGHHQANDSPPMVRYHRLIGHLPMLLHPDPRRALVVGLGGGATPGALTHYPGVQVECVELSPSVVGAARYFRHANDDVLNRPNLRLRVDDGRNHLLLTDQKYDVITADIIVPYHTGAGNLYSVEYYRLCRAALAPGGLMCQWVWQSSRAQYQVMLRTFLQAFPYVTLWVDGSLLIGSETPQRFSPAAIAGKFDDPQVRAALAAVGVRGVEDVLRLYRGNREEILAYVGEGEIASDDRPLLEYYRASGMKTDEKGVPEIHADLVRGFRSRLPLVEDAGQP